MVFLGLLFKKNEEQRIASKSRGGIVQNQVNTFQWNCIDGFYLNGVADFHIINALPVGTFPFKYRDMMLPSKAWEYKGKKHHQIGAINFPILKQWGRYRACKKLLHNLQNEEVLIYSAYLPFLKAIKKLDKSCKVSLIVPDLPSHYDYAKTNVIKKLFRKINNHYVNKCMVRIDRFILLTEQMKEPLKVKNRPYIVLEGIYSGKEEKPERMPSEKKIIFYAGTLNKCFGMDILLEAFEQLSEKNFELWICGDGDYREDIKNAAIKDKRIKFFGYVPRSKVLALQAQASVLVNPRQNTEEYTKYSFPSKTMEYLASEIPLIMYKLDGIPDEYDQYVNYVEGNTASDMAKCLEKILCDKTGIYSKKAQNASEFIIKEKSAKCQTAKILDFIKSTQRDLR